MTTRKSTTTLCDACGLPTPDGVDGRSLLPAIADGVAVHDAVFSEYYTAGIPERMIRTGRWKYVHSHGELHQLYDLETDPHENVNLIDDPAYVAIAAELDAQVCRNWAIPDMSRVPRPRGDTRHGQRGCPISSTEYPPEHGSTKQVCAHVPASRKKAMRNRPLEGDHTP